MFLIVLDGVQGETLWGGESRARDHTHEREQKAGQAAVERTTGQFLIVSQSAVGVVMRERVRVRELHSPFFKLDMMTTRSMGKATKS